MSIEGKGVGLSCMINVQKILSFIEYLLQGVTF